jgi:hypothetical protein
MAAQAEAEGSSQKGSSQRAVARGQWPEGSSQRHRPCKRHGIKTQERVLQCVSISQEWSSCGDHLVIATVFSF